MMYRYLLEQVPAVATDVGKTRIVRHDQHDVGLRLVVFGQDA